MLGPYTCEADWTADATIDGATIEPSSAVPPSGLLSDPIDLDGWAGVLVLVEIAYPTGATQPAEGTESGSFGFDSGWSSSRPPPSPPP